MQDSTALLASAINAEVHSADALKCNGAASRFNGDPAKRILGTGQVEEMVLEEQLCIPFPLLAGEALQYYSEYPANILFLTNFRLFVSSVKEHSFNNVALRCIDVFETRDMFTIAVLCKDAKLFKITFPNSESCLCWQRYLQVATSSPSKYNQVFAFEFAAKSRRDDVGPDSWVDLNASKLSSSVESLSKSRKTIEDEFARLCYDQEYWRICDRNKEYKLCSTYPRYVIIPACITDGDIEKAAAYRTFRRFPSIVWRHCDNGCVLARSSQPEVGLFGWRSEHDEQLLSVLVDSCRRRSSDKQSPRNGTVTNSVVPLPVDSTDVGPKKMIILDCRSYAAAWANRAKGGGFESTEYYQKCYIDFMALPNIHAIRKSFQQLRLLVASSASEAPTSNSYFQLLESCRWLHYLSQLIAAATRVVEEIHTNARPVLVHCSDGWDRTAQVVSLAKILLDPYYRTIEGFRVLIEQEWLEFGHRFSDRCGTMIENENEKSPVFLQWLDCVHQIMQQFPCHFELNQLYLTKLAQHAYSGLFGTFLGNSSAQRSEWDIDSHTISVWQYLDRDKPELRNQLYAGPLVANGGDFAGGFSPHLVAGEVGRTVLWPSFQLHDLRLWSTVYVEPDISCKGRLRPQTATQDEAAKENGDKGLPKAHSLSDIQAITATTDSQAESGPSSGNFSSGLSSGGSHAGLIRTGSVDSIPTSLVSAGGYTVDKGCPSTSFIIGSNESIDGSNSQQSPAKCCAARLLHSDASQVLNELVANVSETDALSGSVNGHSEVVNDCCTNGIDDARPQQVSVCCNGDNKTTNVPSCFGDRTTMFKCSAQSSDNTKDASCCVLQRHVDNCLPATTALAIINATAHPVQNGGHFSSEESCFVNRCKIDVCTGCGFDGVDSVDGVTLAGSMANSTSTTVTNGFSASSYSLNATTNRENGYYFNNNSNSSNLKDASTSTSDISDSQVRSSFLLANYQHACNMRTALDLNDNYNAAALCGVAARITPAVSNGKQLANGLSSNSNGHKISVLEKNGHGHNHTSSTAKLGCFGSTRQKDINAQSSAFIAFKLIDTDGLTKIHDPVQWRIMEMEARNQNKVAQLERELEYLRSMFREAVSCQGFPHFGGRSVVNGRSYSRHISGSSAYGDERNTASDVMEPCSYDSTSTSDLSWEAVDHQDAKPTLWFPDHSVSKCMGCDSPFYLISRRHHCRKCGKVFCAYCSNFECPVPSEQLFEPVRVCHSCYDSLRHCEQES